ncbi:hypothetical protein ABIB48_000600 [Arthrobacter sp. UYCu511]
MAELLAVSLKKAIIELLIQYCCVQLWLTGPEAQYGIDCVDIIG